MTSRFLPGTFTACVDICNVFTRVFLTQHPEWQNGEVEKKKNQKISLYMCLKCHLSAVYLRHREEAQSVCVYILVVAVPVGTVSQMVLLLWGHVFAGTFFQVPDVWGGRLRFKLKIRIMTKIGISHVSVVKGKGARSEVCDQHVVL